MAVGSNNSRGRHRWDNQVDDSVDILVRVMLSC